MPKANPLDFPCPKCNAGVGAKCRNYLNRACAPHAGRVPKHVPRVQPIEAIRERVDVRNAVRSAALMEYMNAVSACGPNAVRYGRWTLRDRTGAREPVVVYCCQRKGQTGMTPRVADVLPGLDTERLGPPFLAVYTNKPGGDDSPGGFGFRWESSFGAIEVPDVASAEELQAAAVRRRDKAMALADAEARKLAEWKARNETPSMFEDAANG